VNKRAGLSEEEIAELRMKVWAGLSGLMGPEE
jgi:hypothetical protein